MAFTPREFDLLESPQVCAGPFLSFFCVISTKRPTLGSPAPGLDMALPAAALSGGCGEREERGVENFSCAYRDAGLSFLEPERTLGEWPRGLSLLLD